MRVFSDLKYNKFVNYFIAPRKFIRPFKFFLLGAILYSVHKNLNLTKEIENIIIQDVIGDTDIDDSIKIDFIEFVFSNPLKYNIGDFTDKYKNKIEKYQEIVHSEKFLYQGIRTKNWIRLNEDEEYFKEYKVEIKKEKEIEIKEEIREEIETKIEEIPLETKDDLENEIENLKHCINKI